MTKQKELTRLEHRKTVVRRSSSIRMMIMRENDTECISIAEIYLSLDVKRDG